MYILYRTLYICAVNAWNIHRHQCGQLGRKAMKLRVFVAELSKNLMLCGKTRRGRPTSLPSTVSKKRKLAPKQPQNDVRKDCVGHFPVVTTKRLRCKHCSLKENTFSSVTCSKFEVTLCLNKERNCFFFSTGNKFLLCSNGLT